jgi:membrane protein
MRFKSWYRNVRSHPKWTRTFDFLNHYLGGLYGRVADHHVFLKAGGMAFSIIVCIMPLTLIIFAVLGAVLQQPKIIAELNDFIDRLVPYQDYAAKVKQLVFARVNEFTSLKKFSGIAGSIALIFAATGLFSSMRTILDSTYHIRTRHAALRGKLRDLGLLFLVLGYFLLATTILPTINVALNVAEHSQWFASLQLGVIEDILIRVLSFLVILLAFLFIYYMVPNKRPPRSVATVSAIWATILWFIARELFGIYISRAVNIDRVYGAYAFAVIVAFWIYYTSVTFIVGAEVGQLYRERHRKRQKKAAEKK